MADCAVPEERETTAIALTKSGITRIEFLIEPISLGLCGSGATNAPIRNFRLLLLAKSADASDTKFTKRTNHKLHIRECITGIDETQHSKNSIGKKLPVHGDAGGSIVPVSQLNSGARKSSITHCAPARLS